MSERSERFWANFGKAGLVLGVIWAAIQIADRYQNRSGLVAQGDIMGVTWPDSVRVELTELAARLDSGNARIRGARVVDSIDTRMREEDKRTAKMLKELLNVGGFATIDIRNEGNKEVRDAVAVIPGEGFYRLTGDDRQAASGTYSSSVVLGTLRPSASIRLQIWSRRNYFYLREFRVTHPDGVVEVNYAVNVRGLLAWLSQLPDAALIVVALLFAVACVMAGTVLRSKPDAPS
jgi:hypothetical protein